MPTLRQKRVAKGFVENLTAKKPKLAGEIVADSGYGPSMSKNPQVILNSEGVREELANLGFSLDSADETVGYLLKHAEKEETQLNAADKIYKRLGGYAAEKHITLNVELEPSKKILDLAKHLLVLQSNHEERSENDTRTKG